MNPDLVSLSAVSLGSLHPLSLVEVLSCSASSNIISSICILGFRCSFKLKKPSNSRSYVNSFLLIVI